MPADLIGDNGGCHGGSDGREGGGASDGRKVGEGANGLGNEVACHLTKMTMHVEHTSWTTLTETGHI